MTLHYTAAEGLALTTFALRAVDDLVVLVPSEQLKGAIQRVGNIWRHAIHGECSVAGATVAIRDLVTQWRIAAGERTT